MAGQITDPWTSLAASLSLAVAAIASWRYHNAAHRGCEQQCKAWFQKLYRPAKMRMTYQRGDFADYASMCALTAALTRAVFGAGHGFTLVGSVLSAFLALAFPVRHEVTPLRAPLIFSAPLKAFDVLRCKLENARPALFLSMSGLCLEQVVISWTPAWNHSCEVYSWLAWRLFYGSFFIITALRMLIFFIHIWYRRHVFDFLRGTHWSKVLGKNGDFSRELVDLLHAFSTGLLCHMLAVGPLFIVLTYFQHSLLLLPVRAAVDWLLLWWFWKADFTEWIWRDHWMLHNCDFHFKYLHGPHHDALPVSIMAAHDTGMLEGFLRFSIGMPESYCTPLNTCLLFSIQIIADMVFHQYVPGVFPYSAMVLKFGHHHAEHHFLSLQPLGSGFERPPDGNMAQSVELDARLVGYDPKNELWAWFSKEATRIEKIGALQDNSVVHKD